LLVIPLPLSDDGLRRDAHPRWGERNFVFWSRAEGVQTPTLLSIEKNLGALVERICVKVPRLIHFAAPQKRLPTARPRT
jgi:hypothetical protein